MKNASDLQVEPEHTDEPGLREAYGLANRFNWSEKELDAYYYWGMLRQDARGMAELALEKGLQEGMEKGLQEEMEKGLQEGMKAGRLSEKIANLKLILETRFNVLPSGLYSGIEEVEDERFLGELLREAVVCSSLRDFEQKLRLAK